MCDAMSLVALAVMAGGATANAKGQRDAAKAQKRTLAKAMSAQEGLRKKALGQSEEVVKQQGAEALAEDAQQPQKIVAEEGAKGDQLTKAFAESAGIKAGDQGRIIGAARGAKRTAKNEATRSGFSRALQANLARLGNLTTNNLLLGEDSRRISAALPYQMQRAGAAGSDWRLAGQLGMTAGQAGLSYNAWQPQGQPSDAGMAGVDYGPDYRRPSGQVQV